MVWVEGEISNFRAPGPHWYFTLKDANAQLRSAMFRGRNRFVKVPIRDGTQVIVRGYLSLFEARGDFQLIVEHLELAGEGRLRAAFEALKAKLDAEGLFADARKQPIPTAPRHVAVVTSLSGAAIEDVLAVVKRRHPAITLTCIPTPVQGEEAPRGIASALDAAAQMAPRPDVVLLVRGGGSLEDLWAFNTEPVARAVAACPIPLVCAVGHEVDVSIADLVADQRASTPTAAAELVSPDSRAIVDAFTRYARRIMSSMRRGLQAKLVQEQGLRGRLPRPDRTLQERQQRIDSSVERMVRSERRTRAAARARLEAIHRRIRHPRDTIGGPGGLGGAATRLAQLDQRLLNAAQGRVVQASAALQLHTRLLASVNPFQQIERHANTARELALKLRAEAGRQLARRRDGVASVTRALHAVSPVRVLERGYAIVARDDATRWGAPVSAAADVRQDEPLKVHLADGSFDVTVR